MGLFKMAGIAHKSVPHLTSQSVKESLYYLMINRSEYSLIRSLRTTKYVLYSYIIYICFVDFMYFYPHFFKLTAPIGQFND